MKFPQRCKSRIAFLVVWALFASAARGDEGMWLFNRPPRRQLQERYQFSPTNAWLERVQRSAVRFNDGGSGSFVSADGLIMANQHVGADFLPQLGDARHNYFRDGFYARTRSEELRCPGLEAQVLMSIEDVTGRVGAAIKPGMTAEQAVDARRAIVSEIEGECVKTTGLHGEVVTLYHGGEYHLYRYKRYADVRVVFAPEQQIAFFGGDPDNFEYPRYDYDIYFFRAYEGGNPAKVTDHLSWSVAGAQENDLVFIPGHPRQTNRLNTVAALGAARDTGYPFLLDQLYRTEVFLSAWSDRSDENARKAKQLLFITKDSRKAVEGGLSGLLEPELFASKQAAENQLRTAIGARATLRDAVTAWDRIAKAEMLRAKSLRTDTLLERGAGFNSTLFTFARVLVRSGAEKTKPDGERLHEFTEGQRPSLEQALFSPEPIDKEFETLKLADSLTWLNSQLPDAALVQQILAGKSPRERAVDLVRGSRLDDVAVRKSLYDRGQAAADSSDDPMMGLARLVDRPSRAARKTVETQVDEVEREAYAQIAKAKYAIEGGSTYPDATSTLRLSFGTVRGYEREGRHVPAATTFAGLYERSREHDGRPPFDLPPRWTERKSGLDQAAPFNFICTADVVGGNSGAPVIDRKSEIVGVVFDRNLPSMALDFAYTDKQARAMAVHSRAIIDGLRKIYDAAPLVDEIMGPH